MLLFDKGQKNLLKHPTTVNRSFIPERWDNPQSTNPKAPTSPPVAVRQLIACLRAVPIRGLPLHVIPLPPRPGMAAPRLARRQQPRPSRPLMTHRRAHRPMPRRTTHRHARRRSTSVPVPTAHGTSMRLRSGVMQAKVHYAFICWVAAKEIVADHKDIHV